MTDHRAVGLPLLFAAICLAPASAAPAPRSRAEDDIRKGNLRGTGSEVHLQLLAPKRFKSWLKKANEHDSAYQWLVGRCYEEGAGVKENMTTAAQWYRKSAEQGYAPAQYNLAVCYVSGSGVKADDAEALKWYHKAADAGYGRALEVLAGRYENGKGVKKDSARADELYRRAVAAYTHEAEAGYSGSQFSLGLLYTKGGRGAKKDNAAGIRWYRAAAENGHAWSQTNLGHANRYGHYGLKKDPAEARRLFVLAGKQGDTLADYLLASMYLDGDLPGKDGADARALYQKVIKAYRQAAHKGDNEAKYFLGELYENGYGTSVDRYEAVHWYRRAAESGYTRAQFKLGQYYDEGKCGLTVDPTKAAEWYRRASNNGSFKASRRLAEMYEKGIGVAKDAAEAVKLRAKAKKQAGE